MVTEVDVSGITVSFPFEPYPAQVEFMRSVVKCLQHGFNGLLESPTGTGKTLCLLCSTLGWLAATSQGAVLRHTSDQDQKGRGKYNHKVVYCSRTHAQLTQVVRELKRTSYAQCFTMAVLGSREHMCLNKEVTRLPSSQAQHAMCSALRSERNCRFFRGLLSAAAGASLLSPECAVHDMEDLMREGSRSGFCPYFHERDAAKDADVVLMPYNYVLDPSLHKQLPFELADCILIVDEAHNLPSVLSSSGCQTLSPLDVTTAIHDCSRAIAMHRLTTKGAELDEDVAAEDEQELASLKILLSRLEMCVYAEPMTEATAAPTPTQCDVVRDGSYMFVFLEKAFITREVFGAQSDGVTSASGLAGTMGKCVTLLADSERPATSMARVQEFLTRVFAFDMAHLDSTRFVLQQHLVAAKAARTLGFWELDNTRLMRQVVLPLHSVLLTSGTLSPLDQFAAELGMEFQVRLKGNHVIQPDQVLGGVLCRGPSGEKLNGGFSFRSSVDYRVGLGMSLANIARNTPGGTLVFFPSYASMNSVVELWQAGSGRAGDTKTVWGMLSELKPIFVEPSNSNDLPTIVQSFQKEVDTSPLRGAILLAVCRGKISEGIDFADNHGRCVLVAGIPYANHTDLFVRLKRDYITSVAPQRPLVHGKLFTGDDWYRNEAMRAVNQCVGRVIRHKDDYGVVLLADERFEGLLGSVSEWVQRRTRVFSDFRGAYAAVAQFFGGRRHRATETAAIPYVLIENGANAAAELPSTATLARLYADAQARQREEHVQETRRRRFEEVREAKASACNNAVASATSPFAPASFAGCSTTGRAGGTPAIPQRTSAETPEATVVSSERETAGMRDTGQMGQPDGPPKLGPTSKEFCEFLKARVPVEAYHRFKMVLAQLATLRPLLRTSPTAAADGLARLLVPLRSVFGATDGEYHHSLFAEFGRHIPEEFRPLYADLLKSNGLM
ncbi:helicase, putative [Leishmania donovani]|uniref:DNA repair helicase (Rad3) family protein n=1 Tax=Leishmania donovani TaxID=5661 RepID=E9BL74_LEIDO|nr:helicase, putative [Leishmania donovani]TPP52898.1 DNA repair helicase (rad3) family protein [Leishmania donovani]CBZ36002.1 helicase, putative [Leishmania donovani]